MKHYDYVEIELEGITYEVAGYKVDATPGSTSTPPTPCWFEVHEIKIGDVNVEDVLRQDIIDSLVEKVEEGICL